MGNILQDLYTYVNSNSNNNCECSRGDIIIGSTPWIFCSDIYGTE